MFVFMWQRGCKVDCTSRKSVNVERCVYGVCAEDTSMIEPEVPWRSGVARADLTTFTQIIDTYFG